MKPRIATCSTAVRAAALAALLLGAGCTTVKPFTYRPAGPKAAAPALPARLAVLPFEDATEDYEKKGGYLEPETLWFNLARAGVPTVFEPVTAPLWAQAFARELGASGRFRSVRYCVDASEVQDEDYLVTGALLRADAAGGIMNANQYALRAVATRRRDGLKVWERAVARTDPSKRHDEACGTFGIDCQVEALHQDLRVVLAGMFEELGADLARALAGGPAGGGAAPGPKPAATPAAGGETVDETIRKIMEGK